MTDTLLAEYITRLIDALSQTTEMSHIACGISAYIMGHLKWEIRDALIGWIGNLGSLGKLGSLGSLGSLGNLGKLGKLGSLGSLGSLGKLGKLETMGTFRLPKMDIDPVVALA